VYGNNSSKQPFTRMIDGNPQSYWDAGHKLKNYCVFDFGRTVKCMRMRYTALNQSSYAPKQCDLFAGLDPDPQSSGWKRVYQFCGPRPGRDTKKEDTGLHYESGTFNVRTRCVLPRRCA
jgi:hypothetical protein